MKWPLLSGIIAAILSFFGAHSPVAHAPMLHAPSVVLPASYRSPQTASAADALGSPQPAQTPAPSASATAPRTSQDNAPNSPIVLERVQGADTAALSAKVDSLIRIVANLASLIPVTPQNQLAAIDQAVAANGNPLAPFAASNAINSLSNVTITNSSLTASEIPALNYFPATNTVSISYGGTGISNTPAYGQLLVGNGSGGYGLMATSSLGIVGGSSLLSSSNL